MTYYFKGSKILAPLSITSNEPIYDTDTISLSKQRASQGAQRWEVAFNTVSSGETEADLLVGIITNLAVADTMIMPQLPSVDRTNTAGVSLAISANKAAGQSSVTIVNNGIIAKGSFIKFSNHAKIYMVTADVTAGTKAVSIYPSLRSAVTTAHTFKTGASATFTYYRDVSNLRGLTFTDGLLSSAGTINLVEALV
jgi:hypothetical protein